jgi:hypothetical protein
MTNRQISMREFQKYLERLKIANDYTQIQKNNLLERINNFKFETVFKPPEFAHVNYYPPMRINPNLSFRILGNVI